MGWVHVWENGGQRQYQVHDGLMRRHLPDIAMQYPRWIELTRMAQTSFFNTAEKTANKDDFPTHVSNHLNDMVRRGSAIHKIRNHLTTIAYLCARGRAPSIPAYLTSFVAQHAQEIVAEDYLHLRHWEYAIKSLTKLGPTTVALNELSRARNLGPGYPTHIQRPYSPPYNSSNPNYGPYGLSNLCRGRSPTRTGPRYRSRTMPPMILPAQIAPPDFLAIPASRGIMSGFPSPSVFARDPLEAEIQEMRDNQLYLEEQVAQLQVGQQELVDEVVQQQVAGYAPLQQLTWPS
ncbi:hypothetical protein DPSP01_013987 [Paraphaeosphaeria sporulosa]